MSPRGRIVAWLSAAVAAGVVATLALVALMPRDHKVELVVTWPTVPPDKAWQLLTSHADEPRWLPAFASAERQPDDHGRPAWTYRDASGAFNATMLTILAEPGRRLERLLLRDGQSDDRPWDVRWVFDLEPAGPGTRLRFTEHGWTGGFRFFIEQRVLGSPHQFPLYYLRQMGRALGDPAEVEVLRTH
jgi:hypothetical protein